MGDWPGCCITTIIYLSKNPH